MQAPSKDFWISYAKDDRTWANWIAWQLENVGYTTILQDWDLRAGSNFILEIDKASHQARWTIALLSPSYLESDFKRAEWATILAQDPGNEQGTLIPIQVHECRHLLQGILKSLTFINLVGEEEEQALQLLLKGIARERIKPLEKPLYPLQDQIVLEQFPGTHPHIWIVPFPRRHTFTGREDILRQLHNSLQRDSASRIALSGLGGIGKTQTAVEYIYRYYSDYPQGVVWIRAETRETITTDFLALAKELRLKERKLSLLTQEKEEDPAKLVNAAKNWLATHNNWLLIFDNVEEFEMVQEFFPLTHPGSGQIIITTRNPAIRGREIKFVELEKMPTEDGTLFLLRRVGLLNEEETIENAKATDCENALLLAEQMDGLPLALDQAGAYIEEMKYGLSEYLELYHLQRKSLLEQRGQLVVDHPDSVTATFLLSFEKIKQKNPYAIGLLKLCAFLDPDNIKRDLLQELVAVAAPFSFSLSPLARNQRAFNNAIVDLCNYSLIRHTGETFIMHRLVQAVLKDQMSVKKQRKWTNRILYYFNKGANRFRQYALSPYTEESELQEICVEHIQHYDLRTRIAAYLLVTRAYTVSRQAYIALQEGSRQGKQKANSLYETANELFEHALAIIEKLYGSEHQWIAYYLIILAQAIYVPQKKYTDAYALYQRALKIDEHLLEPAKNEGSITPVHRYATILRQVDRGKEATQLVFNTRELRAKKLAWYLPPVIFTLLSLLAGFLPVSSLLLPPILGAIFHSWLLFGVCFIFVSLPCLYTTLYIYKYNYLLSNIIGDFFNLLFSKKVLSAKQFLGNTYNLSFLGIILFIGAFFLLVGTWGIISWFVSFSLLAYIHINLLVILLPYLLAVLGVFLAGLGTLLSETFLLEGISTEEAMAPLPLTFYSLSSISIPIITSFFFRSWIIAVAMLTLIVITTFLFAFLNEKSYHMIFICLLFIGGACTGIALWFHSWLISLVLIGGMILNYIVAFFIMDGVYKNNSLYIQGTALLLGSIWSLLCWLLGNAIAPSLPPGLLEELCPYTLAILGFSIGSISHLIMRDWLICLYSNL